MTSSAPPVNHSELQLTIKHRRSCCFTDHKDMSSSCSPSLTNCSVSPVNQSLHGLVAPSVPQAQQGHTCCQNKHTYDIRAEESLLLLSLQQDMTSQTCLCASAAAHKSLCSSETQTHIPHSQIHFHKPYQDWHHSAPWAIVIIIHHLRKHVQAPPPPMGSSV
ncbi:hypothetical protein JOB18_021832 [Solea senegalensis]|uniref:Uncharacterized protein n=1 Tax=Solea senegalensis TaxID=28829 RepID=A0AAV6S8P2_SOLSE|nr:hypothetical protein JOB18_021832 [Solea senegalensis]